jgi:hypothetical protein
MSFRPDGQAVFDDAELLLDDIKLLSLPHYAMSASGSESGMIERAISFTSGHEDEATLARRVGHLATTFDFDALRALADTLSAEAEHAGA